MMLEILYELKSKRSNREQTVLGLAFLGDFPLTILCLPPEKVQGCPLASDTSCRLNWRNHGILRKPRNPCHFGADVITDSPSAGGFQGISSCSPGSGTLQQW